MMEAKIQFSGAEMDLMNNANIILTKNAVMQKIKALFEETQQSMMHMVAEESKYSLYEIFANTPKISRGENYRGLPYIVLDYPRQLELTDNFIIRTMFWWGHFFSITLQISGKYQDHFSPKIMDAYTSLTKRNFYVGINDDPWQHHFDEDNYKLISEYSEEEFGIQCSRYPHLKIARHFPLWDVHFVAEDLLNDWEFLLSLCHGYEPPSR